MANKIGDAVIALVFFAFIVTAFTQFFNAAEVSTGGDTGIVGDTLTELNAEGDEVVDLNKELAEKTDETSTMSVNDESQELETRGADATGFMNLISKNIIVRFAEIINKQIDGAAYVIGFIIAIITLTITILVLRFFWGDGKI